MPVIKRALTRIDIQDFGSLRLIWFQHSHRSRKYRTSCSRGRALFFCEEGSKLNRIQPVQAWLLSSKLTFPCLEREPANASIFVRTKILLRIYVGLLANRWGYRCRGLKSTGVEFFCQQFFEVSWATRRIDSFRNLPAAAHGPCPDPKRTQTHCRRGCRAVTLS